jgi:putative phage-type endonuclease
MRTIELTQGTPEWHAHRAAHFNASDAPAMMGASKYKTRTQLLMEYAGAVAPDVSREMQRRFDAGHAAEAAARPKIEALIGEELYPVVGVSDEHPKLSASYDGLTMNERTGYECKLWSEDMAAQIRSGELSPAYYWQLEHQCLVGGLERVIFVAANEDASKLEYLEYRPQPGRAEQLLAGWAQFERDLAEFRPQASEPEAIGRSPETLPALRIEVTGMVTASNLDEFRDRAIAVFRGIKTDLQTDQDFADAEKAVKWCAEIEDRLKAAKQHALSQTASIDQLFRAIDDIGAEARTKRLELEKLVKARKEAVRLEIVNRARTALEMHVKAINATMPSGYVVQMPSSFHADIAAAIKGKKTLASLQDAADTALAQAKIAVYATADAVRQCAQIFDQHAEYVHLFPDRHILALSKSTDDLRNLVAARIAKHQADEQARLDRERERIRQEEADKLRREQEARERAQPSLAPASNQAQSAPKPAARGKSKPTRPSDDEIIASLALHYRVEEYTVLSWLREMDLNGAGERLASNY